MSIKEDMKFGLPEQDLSQVLEKIRKDWEQLRGACLFITGGTGFFGRWLLGSLCYANNHLNLGVRAVVLTRNPDDFRARAPYFATDPAIELWEGDVRWFEFPKGYFTHIIHGATDTSQAGARNPLELIETIVSGTRRVLEFARFSRVRRLLYLSSGAVYGAQPPELATISEDHLGACDPLDPRSAYGEAKRLAEHLCILYGQEIGLESVFARGFAFVGPFLPLDTHFAIGNFIRDALYGDTIRIQGDGTPQRSYLYTADLAIWLWIMLIKGCAGRAYNLGSNHSVNITDLAELVASELAPGKPVTIATMPAESGFCNRYIPSIDRARRELDLDIWTELTEAIRRTGDWYRLIG